MVQEIDAEAYVALWRGKEGTDFLHICQHRRDAVDIGKDYADGNQDGHTGNLP